MASVNDMFNEVTKEQSFYKKGEKKSFTPFTKGEYYGHITEVDSKILDVKGGQYKARLFTYTVTVAPENINAKFQYENINGDMQLVNWSCSKKIKEILNNFNTKSRLISPKIAA